MYDVPRENSVPEVISVSGPRVNLIRPPMRWRRDLLVLTVVAKPGIVPRLTDNFTSTNLTDQQK